MTRTTAACLDLWTAAMILAASVPPPRRVLLSPVELDGLPDRAARAQRRARIASAAHYLRPVR